MQDTSPRQVLLPSPLEVLGYFLIGGLVLVFMKIGLVVSRFSSVAVSQEVMSEDFLGSLSFLSEFPILNTLVIVIFWSGIGLFAYTLVWAVINAFIEARNEIVVESEYVNKGGFRSRFSLPALKTVLLVTMAGYLLINIKWLLPWLTHYFGLILVSRHGVGLVTVLVPMVIMVIDIAILVLLFRAITHPTVLLHVLSKKDTQ